MAPNMPPPVKVPLSIKLGYGFGSVAYGIKDNGFAVFLLFYYNQVVGLDASLVGAALLIALLADALYDPIVGQLSDSTRTRIGKRHPWLYAAALPITISWLMLWHPPEMSNGAAFFYVLTVAIFVRVSMSSYEVPSLAMMPELTSDPHERTNIMRFRFLFGWGGGLVMMALAFAIFLSPTAQYTDGQLNPAGYSQYAILGALVMLISVLVAAFKTHKPIVSAYHDKGSAADKNGGFGEIIKSFTYPPFARLLLVSFFAYTNQGIIFALTLYLFRHIWELDQVAFFIYSLCLFFGVVIAFVSVGPVSKKLGKPHAAALFMLISLAFGSLPYWSRLLGIFPDNDSTLMMPMLFSFLVAGTGFGISAIILAMSMMADISDMYQEDTGKKSEGLFSAGMFFMQKLVGGIGLFLASSIIAIVGLPDGAQSGTVAPDIVANLNLYYVTITTIIALLTALAFSRLTIRYPAQTKAPPTAFSIAKEAS